MPDNTLTVSEIDLETGTLEIQGPIEGAKVLNTSGAFLSEDGELDGATWQGVLALDGPINENLLSVSTSLKVLNQAGSGCG